MTHELVPDESATADAGPEWHIASLVVHVLPQHVIAASSAIAGLKGACVHGSAPNGKVVVTLEADSAAAMLDQVAQVRATTGVLTASLVYQCADSLQAMNEVLPDGDRETRLH